jgi:peptidoglycan hydrolase CwlO-like protein
LFRVVSGGMKGLRRNLVVAALVVTVVYQMFLSKMNGELLTSEISNVEANLKECRETEKMYQAAVEQV